MNAIGTVIEQVPLNSAVALPSQAKVSRAGLGLFRILVVEDEHDVAMSICKRLAHAGYEVDTASDGASATASVVRFSPDAVVLDIGIPCGNGFVVAERLRNNPKTMETPIIFLTARTSDEDRQRAEELGAVAFITKPFKSEELLDSVERMLGR